MRNPLSIRQKNYLFIFIITVVPVVVWFLMSPLSVRFQDTATSLQSIGQLTGIIGMMFFSVVFFYSARFRWIERIFGPLNELYLLHHILGVLAFFFLLLHPIALVIAHFIAQKPNLAYLVIPGLQASTTWGILSLWTAIVLLILTLYFRPKYGVWKRTHQLLGVALFFGGLHGLTINSDISRSLFLKLYLLSFAGVALFIYIAFTVLKRLTVKYYAYKASQVRQLSDAVMTVTLTPANSRYLRVLPGQFIFVQFLKDKGWSEAHPFSVSSIQDDGVLRISFKALGDETTEFIYGLHEGVTARLEGPFGCFGKMKTACHRMICVGGGIGITPFLSLIEHLPPLCQVEMFYAVKNEMEGVHLARLRKLAEAGDGRIHIRPWFSEHYGYLTAEAMRELVHFEENDQFFLCGPQEMMRNLRIQLHRLGIAETRIHSEEFSL